MVALFGRDSLFSRVVCDKNPSNVVGFEEALFPAFQVILQKDVQGEWGCVYNIICCKQHIITQYVCALHSRCKNSKIEKKNVEGGGCMYRLLQELWRVLRHDDQHNKQKRT